MTAGTTLYLECDADGDPIPTLSWKINGRDVAASSSSVTNRISLHNENTELEIENVTVADSGESFYSLTIFFIPLRFSVASFILLRCFRCLMFNLDPVLCLYTLGNFGVPQSIKL